MTLLARFVGWACLVAAVVIAALTPVLAAAKTTSPDEQAAASSSIEFNEKDGTLNIEWSGPILPGMADYLRAALDTYAAASHRVVLFLDSAGGQVEEGDRVIHVLDEIKQTHRLITAVLDDQLCASMCIPIFLRGDDRLAARTSLWLFHEAAKQGADGKERMEETLRLFHKYYVPAGVCPDWIRRIVPIVKRADLWESGDDLVSAKTRYRHVSAGEMDRAGRGSIGRLGETPGG